MDFINRNSNFRKIEGFQFDGSVIVKEKRNPRSESNHGPGDFDPT
ncbi:hypothetical protein BVRB_6g147830 [Beta vulgaris subsp. vulgaris]|nr:hypothetical protein BVRB_6g147830 [Beta vulgaris subsp. vulgaris]